MKRFIEFINELFSIQNETSATIVITLTIFILGFILTGVMNIIRAYNSRKSIRNLFIDLLIEVSKTALKQADYFKSFEDILSIENKDFFRLKKTPINHLDNLSKLSINAFHEAYFTGFENIFCRKIRQKAFNKIWIHISSLSFWEEKHHNELKDFINKFNSYENKRNDELETWRKISDQLIYMAQQQNVEGKLREYFTKYDKIVYTWQNAGQNTHYFVVQRDLIEPLRKLNREYKELPFVLTLTNPLLGVTSGYENLVSLLNVNKITYHSHYQSYKNSGRIIAKAIKILK